MKPFLTQVKRYFPWEEVVSFVAKTEEHDKINLRHVVFASTVAFSNDVFLHPLPKAAFFIAEKYIEEIFEHEHLHLGMYRCGLIDTSRMFDNLFPQIGDLQILKEGTEKLVQ